MDIILLLLAIVGFLSLRGFESRRDELEMYGTLGPKRAAELEAMGASALHWQKEAELFKDKEDVAVTDKMVRDMYASIPELTQLERAVHEKVSATCPDWEWGYPDEPIRYVGPDPIETMKQLLRMSECPIQSVRDKVGFADHHVVPIEVACGRESLYGAFRRILHCARHGKVCNTTYMFGFPHDQRIFRPDEVSVETMVKMARIIKTELEHNGITADLILRIRGADITVDTTNYLRAETSGKYALPISDYVRISKA